MSPHSNHLSQPSDGRTTLHLAVEHNRLNIVQLLLARNADIRAQDRWGCTALHVAAMKGHEESTKLLISYYTTSSSSLHDLPHILDSYGATPFHVAADSGLSTRIISILLSAGAAIDLRDTRAGFSPLHFAAQKGHESIVRILVDSGASVGMNARCGWNALHLAVQGGHDAVVAVLLERGAEVDGRTEAGSI
ncbi:ankyrin repeat-containing domain protein [Amylocarpus encephaloides]|uniref:Ankyrin repeat-containing domain protein n=1 Tax=Amylocarpus encephaloides TaxID=45428 RepID=A0A9P7YRQ8_9HELO|nr:ankyrin repeat-containing domain protein [Amylocarpus encephaloides]